MGKRFEIPDDVLQASMTCDPETIFKAASTHYTPKVVGMATERPYSGAGIHGFVEHVPGKGYMVFNGFLMNYYNNLTNTGYMETRFLGLDDLATMSFRCLNDILAAQIKIVMAHNAAPKAKEESTSQ